MKTLQEFIKRYFKGEYLMVYEQDGNNCELLTPDFVKRCNYNEDDIINITYEKHFDCITIYVRKK